MSLGSNIHNFRIAKGYSMKELAVAAGVTTSLISQIEHDKANPSINTLLSISSALNVSISEFFTQTKEDPSEAYIIKKEDRIPVGNPKKGWTQLYLTHNNLDALSVTLNVLEPGATTKKIPEVNHPLQTGYEFGLVLEGKLRIDIENKPYILEEDDAITFDASKKHILSNASTSTTKILWVVIPGMET